MVNFGINPVLDFTPLSATSARPRTFLDNFVTPEFADSLTNGRNLEALTPFTPGVIQTPSIFSFFNNPSALRPLDFQQDSVVGQLGLGNIIASAAGRTNVLNPISMNNQFANSMLFGQMPMQTPSVQLMQDDSANLLSRLLLSLLQATGFAPNAEPAAPPVVQQAAPAPAPVASSPAPVAAEPVKADTPPPVEKKDNPEPSPLDKEINSLFSGNSKDTQAVKDAAKAVKPDSDRDAKLDKILPQKNDNNVDLIKSLARVYIELESGSNPSKKIEERIGTLMDSKPELKEKKDKFINTIKQLNTEKELAKAKADLAEEKQEANNAQTRVNNLEKQRRELQAQAEKIG